MPDRVQPAWSADGKSITFLIEDDRSVHLARVPAAGGTVAQWSFPLQCVRSTIGFLAMSDASLRAAYALWAPLYDTIVGGVGDKPAIAARVV